LLLTGFLLFRSEAKAEMINMNEIVKTHDIVFITLDSLRLDAAQAALSFCQLPNLWALMGGRRWEERHSSGSFTYAAHHAFFAGFLPTQASPGPHPRLFAASFAGSMTTVEGTFTFPQSTMMEGLSELGFTTLCAGGVGFFNKQSALGRIFPDMFDHSHWEKKFGVTEKDSATHQFSWMANEVAAKKGPVFAFVNVSAIHQPNCHYVEGQTIDNVESQIAALAYVDSRIPILVDAFTKRMRDSFWIICSDHGSAYGEDGYEGHRLGHSTVWDVPYIDFIVIGNRGDDEG